MEVQSILTILVLLVGFYMAWNIGANDVSNAMGTSVGSGALTLRRAVLIAAVLEFCGAYFVGSTVTETMQHSLIDISQFTDNPKILIYGMCASLLGTGVWLQLASYYGLPVSTTHAIIGAILGFGVLTLGWGGIEWGMIGSIALSWIISPVISGIVSYFIFSLLQKKILFALDPAVATKRFIPFLLFWIFGTFSLSLFMNGLGRVHLSLSFPQAIGMSGLVALVAAAIGFIVVRKLPLSSASLSSSSRYLPQSLISLEKAIKHLHRMRTGLGEQNNHHKISQLLDEMHSLKKEMQKDTSFPERTSEYRLVEKAFGFMQIISACFVAFAHGANDVANAIAPVATVLDVIKNGVPTLGSAVPSWLLLFGGAGIVIGLATWGWRVIETIGRKITELTPTRGFSAEFGAAITILIASKLGFPISTTHCLVGAVLGVGLARGLRALNLRLVKDIALSWVITLPASALMSILAYLALRAIFG